MAFRDGSIAYAGTSSDEFIATHLPELIRVAFLFSGDAGSSSRRAGTALGHALARPFAARNPESTYLRALGRIARRAPRKPRAGDARSNDLWKAYLALSRRRRVAIALRVGKGMGPDAISQVLGCSPSGAESLISHARSELGRSRDLDVGSLESKLGETFEAQLASFAPRSAAAPARPWAWRSGVLLAVAFVAGVGSVTIPRWLDPKTSEAAPVAPAIDDSNTPRVALPPGFRRVGPKLAVANGTVSGVAAWNLKAYRAEEELVCFELRVGNSYGDRHCISATLSSAHAFASPDPAHNLTFIYGNVAKDIAGVTLVEKGKTDRPFEVVAVPKRLHAGKGNLFAGLIAGYMLPLTSEEDGEFQNYRLADLSLLGSDADDQPVVSYDLLLGRPQT